MIALRGSGGLYAFGLLAVILGWGGWEICQRTSVRNTMARSSIVTEQTYRCEACGAEFVMDWEERREVGAAGKVVIGLDGVARLPCLTCGEVGARIKVGGDVPERDKVN